MIQSDFKRKTKLFSSENLLVILVANDHLHREDAGSTTLRRNPGDRDLK
jgi:hypothetical protein